MSLNNLLITCSLYSGSISAGGSQRAACRAVRERVSAVVRDAAPAEGLTVLVLRGGGRRRRAGAGGAGAGRAAAAGLRVAPPPRRAHRGLADRHLAALARRAHHHALRRVAPAARRVAPCLLNTDLCDRSALSELKVENARERRGDLSNYYFYTEVPGTLRAGAKFV